MEIVVFCYRGSIYYPYRFAVIFPRKTSIQVTMHGSENYYRTSENPSPEPFPEPSQNPS